jgi:hypothetical protein
VKRYACLFGLLLVVGCCFGPKPKQYDPESDTSTGKECLRNCSEKHSLCVSECPREEAERVGCIDGCSQKLQECYDPCMMEESF